MSAPESRSRSSEVGLGAWSIFRRSFPARGLHSRAREYWSCSRTSFPASVGGCLQPFFFLCFVGVEFFAQRASPISCSPSPAATLFSLGSSSVRVASDPMFCFAAWSAAETSPRSWFSSGSCFQLDSLFLRLGLITSLVRAQRRLVSIWILYFGVLLSPQPLGFLVSVLLLRRSQRR
jgi:hypothetical protein